jgi:hypothetical protein
VSDFAFGDEFGECADGVFNGRLGVNVVLVIEIDVISVKAAQ